MNEYFLLKKYTRISKAIISACIVLINLIALPGLAQKDAMFVNSQQKDSLTWWDPSTLRIRLTPCPVELINSGEMIKSGKVDLNGQWQFHTDPPAEFWKKNDLSEKAWITIKVPGEWVMQGFKVDSGVERDGN